mgnify:CR=1 FL=1
MLESVLKLAGAVVVFFSRRSVAVFVGTWLIQFLWAWVVPDVFAGAVKNGNLPASLEFWQAFKLSLFLSVLGVAGHSS